MACMIKTQSTDNPAEIWRRVTDALKAHDTGKVRIRFNLHEKVFEAQRTAAVLYGGMLLHKESFLEEEDDPALDFWTPDQLGIAWGTIITGGGPLVTEDDLNHDYDPVEHLLESLELELL